MTFLFSHSVDLNRCVTTSATGARRERLDSSYRFRWRGTYSLNDWAAIARAFIWRFAWDRWARLLFFSSLPYLKKRTNSWWNFSFPSPFLLDCHLTWRPSSLSCLLLFQDDAHIFTHQILTHSFFLFSYTFSSSSFIAACANVCVFAQTPTEEKERWVVKRESSLYMCVYAREKGTMRPTA